MVLQVLLLSLLIKLFPKFNEHSDPATLDLGPPWKGRIEIKFSEKLKNGPAWGKLWAKQLLHQVSSEYSDITCPEKSQVDLKGNKTRRDIPAHVLMNAVGGSESSLRTARSQHEK